MDYKKPQWLEWFNAVTMLPGIFYALTAPVQTFGNYTYLIVCLSSINFHLFRSFYDYRGNARKYMQFLRIDLIAQSITMACNAYYTPLGLFGVAWAIMSIGLDIYNTTAYKTIESYTVWIRPINQGILIYFLTRHDFATCIMFLHAFLCFGLSKVSLSLNWLHGIFHILMHWGMAELWTSQAVTFPTAVHPAFAVLAILLWMSITVRSHGRRWKYIDHIATSTFYSALALGSFWAFYDDSQLFEIRAYRDLPALQQFQVYSELSYYTAYTIIELTEGQWSLIIHHALSFIIILAPVYYGYPHFLVLALAILLPSNVPLTISKWAHHSGRTTLAKRMFMGFAGAYFISRICGFPFIIYYSMVRGYNEFQVARSVYFSVVCVFAGLYALQWHWLFKIIGLLRHSGKN